MKLVVLLPLLLWVIGIVGWLANVWKIVSYVAVAHGDLSAMLIVRIIGVFAAPLGVALGFV